MVLGLVLSIKLMLWHTHVLGFLEPEDEITTIFRKLGKSLPVKAANITVDLYLQQRCYDGLTSPYIVRFHGE
jgi:hypothetical protein